MFVLMLICLAASLTNYFSKNASLYLKAFPVFLFFILGVEYVARQMAQKGYNNRFLYNLSSVVEFLFYFFFFYSVYRVANARKMVLAIAIAYLAGALINIFFIQGRNTFHTFSFMAGCLLIIIFGIYYFLELFRFPQAGSIVREPAFWITSALLFYYSCVLPIFGILNYISARSGRYNDTLSFILSFMNVILYSLFTLAFLCKINIRKYTF